jgi:hypothetical protein
MASKGFNIKLVIFFAFIGIFPIAGAIAFSNISQKNSDKYLSVQESKVASLQQELTRLQTEQKAKEEAFQKQITGLNMARVVADNEQADAFFKEIFTWDSGARYDKIRQDFIDKYGENNSFITSFMTENKKICKNPDALEEDREYWNYIDLLGTNMTYEGMGESYAVSIQDDNYTYITTVNWSTHDKAGNEARSDKKNTACVFKYTVTKDGEFLKPDAWLPSYN